MKIPTPQEKAIINEWRRRQDEHEQAKQALKNTLNRYGVASTEFQSARIDFEMLKEEYDKFEREHHKLLDDYK